MSDQPRVLLSCFERVPGPHAVSRRLAAYLPVLTAHYQVDVLSRKDSEVTHIERYLGARLLRVPLSTGDAVSQLTTFERAVRRQLESDEYVLVHVFDPFSGAEAAEQRSSLGFRLVYDAGRLASLDDLEQWRAPKLAARIRRLELYSLMNADRVLVGSEHAQRYVQGLGVGEDRVEILRPPVVASAPSLMESRPGLRLVHVGSDAEHHDLSVAVTAVATLEAQRPGQFRLTILGPETTARKALRALATERGAPVDFQPPLPHADIGTALAFFDVGLLTQADTARHRDFGGGLSRLADYLGAGRPIVAADLPALQQQVPAEAGCFYTCGDAAHLAQVLTRLADEPGLRQRLSTAATAGAAAFSQTSIQAQLLALYQQLAPASGQAAPPAEITELRQAPLERRRAEGPSVVATLDALDRAAYLPSIEHTDPSSDPLPPTPIDDDKTGGWQVTRGGATPSARTDTSRVEVVALGEFFTGRAQTQPPSVQASSPATVAKERVGPPSWLGDGAEVDQPAPLPSWLTQETNGGAQPPSAARRSAGLVEARTDASSSPSSMRPATLSQEPVPLSTRRATPEAMATAPPPLSQARLELPTAPPAAPPTADDIEAAEVDADDIESLDDVVEDATAIEEIAADLGPPPSALDPWFAQLAHGWGPSDGSLFERHTPPTTMPGTS